jgi:hypothetical protein
MHYCKIEYHSIALNMVPKKDPSNILAESVTVLHASRKTSRLARTYSVNGERRHKLTIDAADHNQPTRSCNVMNTNI